MWKGGVGCGRVGWDVEGCGVMWKGAVGCGRVGWDVVGRVRCGVERVRLDTSGDESPALRQDHCRPSDVSEIRYRR